MGKKLKPYNQPDNLSDWKTEGKTIITVPKDGVYSIHVKGKFTLFFRGEKIQNTTKEVELLADSEVSFIEEVATLPAGGG